MTQLNPLELVKQEDVRAIAQASASKNVPSLSRRRFVGLVALSTLGLVSRDFISPDSASANTDETTIKNTSDELYHIFLGEETPRKGGTQKVTVKSGKSYEVKVPANSFEGSQLIGKGWGLQGKDVVIKLHTLFDKSIDIDSKIDNVITAAAIKQSSKERCREVYNLVKSAQYTEDLAALNLLDVIVASSNLDSDTDLNSKIHERYQLARQNSRLIGIENCLDDSLSSSQLNDEEKKYMRSTYQYIRASEPLPSSSYFGTLTDLDTIIQNSSLPTPIKAIYSLASAKTRAFTVDIIIVDLINSDSFLASDEKQKYLEVYNQVRNGEPVEDQYIALLSVSENHAQSKSLRAFPHNDLSDEFLSETQKCRPIGKTHALSGLQRLRSPRVTEER